MQIIKKVLNSSVVLVEDERGVERVLLGKGIGFGAKPGATVAPEATDRVFVALDDTDQRNLVELLAQIPGEFVELTRSIVMDAEDSGIQLDPHIYLTLTDHLHFAVERLRRNLQVTNRLAWEVRTVYPAEYEVGLRALARLRERTGAALPDEEAANIAFHLVNSEVGRPAVDSMRVVGLISDITTIVTHSGGVALDADDLHTRRFLTHLQFFAERLFSDRLAAQDDDLLFATMTAKHPRAVATAERVRAFVRAEHQVAISDEEVGYLALHIARAQSS
ncbi:transcriptional antiterminator, BglG family [Microbacterium hydrothermale]|uniref:PRD domain-containing protein n=1 Tax=Microbacterium hydrothermale TaxID=857427 RepID=UPI002227E468|nr:PRD domain-containing protein [Microbacterium hydrothermale]MCW2166082.1 transcriptional antiterminator, BglG family [Microbacterium hydrothermale]